MADMHHGETGNMYDIVAPSTSKMQIMMMKLPLLVEVTIEVPEVPGKVVEDPQWLNRR